MHMLELGQFAANRLNTALARGSDLLLAAAVLMILAMLIIPLPTPVLDALIALNITIAATTLLASLYIPNAARFPSFPTLLLLTTLFRLAINVSSTRLILLNQNAGEIIFAFGNFVVQGNYVVGAVVFLILVVIQFIVIAKGSERVAEVAARFTLDAMPGKQMSIDADLRAGAIDQAEATRRRRGLEKESQFYGAMDGAMKFVKGDAIASVIIALINIVGGIAIGLFLQKMDLGDAAGTFTLLTIGDGLVSQIPALLLSTAAGLVVTRVAQTEGPADQGIARDIFRQLMRQPRALLYVACFLAGVACLPGFPARVFLTLAVVLAVLAAPGLRRGSAAVSDSEDDLDASPATEPTDPLPAPHPRPLELLVHPALAGVLCPADQTARARLEHLLDELYRSLTHEMGLLCPHVQIELSAALPDCGYVLRIFECPVAGGVIAPDQLVVLAATPSAVAALNGTPIALPWNRVPALLVPAEQRAHARTSGLTTLEPQEFVLLHLAAVLRRHAHEFIGIQETRLLLNNLEEHFPALLQEVVPARLSVQQVAEVLQRLLREEVPIRDLRLILESLARWAQKLKEPADLAESVRRDLGRCISHRYAQRGQDLYVYTFDQNLDRELQQSVRATPAGPVCAPSAQLREELLNAVGRAIVPEHHIAVPPVILTRGPARRYLRALLELEYPEIAVLAYEELAAGLHVRALARIGARAA